MKPNIPSYTSKRHAYQEFSYVTRNYYHKYLWKWIYLLSTATKLDLPMVLFTFPTVNLKKHKIKELEKYLLGRVFYRKKKKGI